MPDNNLTSVASQEKLVTQMRAVISDAEEILSATADQTGEKIASLRERAKTRLSDAKVRLVEAEAMLVDKTLAAAHRASLDEAAQLQSQLRQLELAKAAPASSEQHGCPMPLPTTTFQNPFGKIEDDTRDCSAETTKHF